ncbi:MAG: hypothetical protein NPIRA03_26420 [Nitrospirales bacterium]|nr:MAG: hypothetical protein NPIRA03_26420 [Nitrospirales bacterium]
MAQTRSATDKSVPPGGQPAGAQLMGCLLIGAFARLADVQVVGRWDLFSRRVSRCGVELGSDPSQALVLSEVEWIRMTLPGRMWEGRGIFDSECQG